MEKHNDLRIIGRREYLDLPELGIFHIEAKMDTGAYTSSIHCENIVLATEGGKEVLYVTLELQGGTTLRFEQFAKKKIKNSFGEMEERYVIKTIFHIGKRNIRSIISLSNRDNMRFPVLVGRRLLKGKFLIDVKQVHTGGTSAVRAHKKTTEQLSFNSEEQTRTSITTNA
jgi:hypothetical protein